MTAPQTTRREVRAECERWRAWLAERFGEGWEVYVSAYSGGVMYASAAALRSGVQVAVTQPWDPVERPEGIERAARDAWAKWQAAAASGGGESLLSEAARLLEQHGRICPGLYGSRDWYDAKERWLAARADRTGKG